MAKLKFQEFYGVWTVDDEMGGSIKAYALTKELAEYELKNYRDFWCSCPPTPDEKHIRPLLMLVKKDETPQND